MLMLYYKPTCPFSQAVIQAAQELGIELVMKDITGDMDVRIELKERGGKHQVPFLFDEQYERGLYESEAIIEYLRAHDGARNVAQVFSPVSDQ